MSAFRATEGAATTAAVCVGGYALEVGADSGSFARFARREKVNSRALAAAFAEQADDDHRLVEDVEQLDASATEVTNRVEHAHALFRAVAGGQPLDRAFLMGEVDKLLGLSRRLDREGRFEEQLRLARALHGLLATTFRWLDLIRSLRAALRSAKKIDDSATQAWALHELGSLHLCAGDARTAKRLFQEALRIEEQLGTAGWCSTRHNLESARHDVFSRPSWFGKLVRVSAGPVGKVLTLLVFLTLLVASGGTGAAALQPQLDAESLTFGAVQVGETSTPRTVVLRAGSETIAVERVTAGGGSEFRVEEGCSAILAAYETCGIRIEFQPAAPGRRTATLKVALGSEGTLRGDLVGKGIAPRAARLRPTRLDLGETTVGAESRGTLILRAGSSDLGRLDVRTDSSEFRVTDSCARLAADRSCTIVVVFEPASAGRRSATVIVTPEQGRELVSQLVGTGTDLPPPVAPTLTRERNLGEARVGGASTARTLILRAGSDDLRVLDVRSDSDEFGFTNGCPQTVPAGTDCEIEVTFAPAVEGTRSATLTVVPDGGQVLVSRLVGTGTEPPNVAPTLTRSLDLGEVTLGDESDPGRLTLTAGSNDLSGLEVEIGSEEFEAADDCDISVPAGATCTITVVFAPAVAGKRSATLTVTRADGPPLTSMLRGVGRKPPPTVAPSLSPPSIVLGKVEVGEASPPGTLTLTAGSKDLRNVEVEADSDEFEAEERCRPTVPAGSSCTIAVVFAPASVGVSSARVTVTHDGGPALTSEITGTGARPIPPKLTRSLDLGEVEVGRESAARTLTLTAGSKDLSIVELRSGASEFRQESQCVQPLPAGMSCTIEITFAPAEAGPRATTLVVEVAGAKPLRSRLTGVGLEPLRIRPSAVDFGTVVVGVRKPERVWVLAGSKPLTVTGVHVSNPKQFVLSGTTCEGELAPGATCSITLLFTPLAAGTRTGRLDIAFSDRAAVAIPLKGIGIEAFVVLDPTSLDFGSVAADMPDSVTKTVTLTNTGSATLTIDRITSSNRQFSVKSGCPSTLAAGASCKFTVTFNPSSVEHHESTITIHANGRGQHELTAVGEGVVG